MIFEWKKTKLVWSALQQYCKIFFLENQIWNPLIVCNVKTKIIKSNFVLIKKTRYARFKFDFGLRKAMADWIFEPRCVHSQSFQTLAPLTARPQQHTCINDETQLLNSTNFGRFCPKPRDLAPPTLQVHNFMYRHIISPSFKFLALVVSEFLYLIKKVFNRKKKRIK